MNTDIAKIKPSPIETFGTTHPEKLTINYHGRKIADEILKNPKSHLTINFAPPPEPFGNNSIDRATNSGWSDRSFDQYLDMLEITERDLGSLVLDLGSGKSELFAREAQRKGINVVAVNPKLGEEKARKISSEEIKEDDSYERKAVAALAQALPFRDNCFDSVVSVVAVPSYVDPNDLPTVFKEILRVLKPGGKAFLSPLSFVNQIVCTKILKDLPCSFDLSPKRPNRLLIEKRQAPTSVIK